MIGFPKGEGTLHVGSLLSQLGSHSRLLHARSEGLHVYRWPGRSQGRLHLMREPSAVGRRCLLLLALESKPMEDTLVSTLHKCDVLADSLVGQQGFPLEPRRPLVRWTAPRL